MFSFQLNGQVGEIGEIVQALATQSEFRAESGFVKPMGRRRHLPNVPGYIQEQLLLRLSHVLIPHAKVSYTQMVIGYPKRNKSRVLLA